MTQQDEIRLLLAGGVVKRASELRAAGIRPQAIADALRMGSITRTAAGAYYAREEGSVVEDIGLATAATKMPKAVACLMTAAYLCGLVDRPPAEIWLALPVGAYAAKQGTIPCRIRRWYSSEAFTQGIGTKDVHGVQVRHTAPARTVFDLLRDGSRLGLADAGVLAARRFVQDGGSIAEVISFAEVLKMPRQARQTIDILATALNEASVARG